MSRSSSLLHLRKAPLAQAIAQYMGITPLVQDSSGLSPESFVLSRMNEADSLALESGPIDCGLFLSTDFSWYWQTRNPMTGKEAGGWEPNRWGAITTLGPSGDPYQPQILAQVRGRIWPPMTTPPDEGPRKDVERTLEAQVQKLLYRLLLKAIWGLSDTPLVDIKEPELRKLPEKGE